MEFVTQLWCYKSKQFFLGVQCPELVKNHVWLLLIVFKTVLVGCSFTHLTQPDYFSGFFKGSAGPFQSSQQGAEFRWGMTEDSQQKDVLNLPCKDDQNMQLQLFRYYYWSGTVLLFLFITYIRILRSGVDLTAGKGDDSSHQPLSSGSFQGGNAQIEFMNNTIKIKKEDPCLQRDNLILNSCNGYLLAACSIMCSVYSMVNLLPAIYASSCHQKHTWSISKYPGASFALIDTLIGLSFLALLATAAALSIILDYIPRLFLQALPQSIKRCKRRLYQSWNPKKAWKPDTYVVDYNT